MFERQSQVTEPATGRTAFQKKKSSTVSSNFYKSGKLPQQSLQIEMNSMNADSPCETYSNFTGTKNKAFMNDLAKSVEYGQGNN